MKKLAIAALMMSAVLTAAVSQASYQTIDLSGVVNTTLVASGAINGTTFPTGPQNYGGVPFSLLASGSPPSPAIWHSNIASGSNPRIVDIPVNLMGVTTVYTLMGTFWGEQQAGTLAAIEFFGEGGIVEHVDLDGGVHIRDYNYNPGYTTQLNPAYATEVWRNSDSPTSGQHLDEQFFYLPSVFETITLEKIRVIDNGNTNTQRLFVAAATVETVPVPASLILLGSGLFGLAGIRKILRK